MSRREGKTSNELWETLRAVSKSWDIASIRMPGKEMNRRWVAVSIAMIALIIIIGTIEAGLASRHYFAFSAKFMVATSGGFLATLCFFLASIKRQEANECNTDEGRRAKIEAQREFIGMGFVALGPALMAAFFVVWWLARGVLLDAGVFTVEELALWQFHYAPYLSFIPLTILLVGWGYWTAPLFREAFGYENYVSWMIFGATIVFVSSFTLMMLLGVYMGDSNVLIFDEIQR